MVATVETISTSRVRTTGAAWTDFANPSQGDLKTTVRWIKGGFAIAVVEYHTDETPQRASFLIIMNHTICSLI
jgi:hypothetical protein